MYEAKAVREESTPGVNREMDRDEGEIIVQLNVLEQLVPMLQTDLGEVTRRLVHIINPNYSSLGVFPPSDDEVRKSCSPLATRLEAINDSIRGLRNEIEAWASRIEL